MRKIATARLYASVLFTALVTLGAAVPAHAQFTPRSVGQPVVGEKYWIEASANLWRPGTDMKISSESLGIAGDIIDFKRDLGLTDASFSEFRVTLRPAKQFKLRYQYLPIKYTQKDAVITRRITFNGQQFTVGVPIDSEIDWKTHRVGLEFDFVSMDRGFGGLVLDVRQTQVQAYLESRLVRRETARAQAPIPMLGGIFRFYPIPNLSVTGEVTGCCFGIIEKLFDDSTAHYMDLDFYATYNFTPNVGAQFGFRRFDLGYVIDDDTGDFDLKGIYFGVVARY